MARAAGMTVMSIIEGGDVVEPLKERVLGRVSAIDIVKPGTDEVVVPANTLLDEALVEVIDDAGIDQIEVRSAITCDTRHGVCSRC